MGLVLPNLLLAVKEVYVSNNIYAGIGSRETPPNILNIMTKCAIILAHDGYICSTGAAIGADQAFANGSNIANGTAYLHLPWKSYEEEWVNSLTGDNILYILSRGDSAAYNSVEDYHPSYEKIKEKSGILALHARNYNILMKPEKVKFIICWTKNAGYIGGTAQALRIADDFDIPVYNLGNIKVLNSFINKINLYEGLLKKYEEYL